MPIDSIHNLISQFLERNGIDTYTFSTPVRPSSPHTVVFNIAPTRVEVPFLDSTTLDEFKESINDAYKRKLKISLELAKIEYEHSQHYYDNFKGLKWE